MVPFPSLHLVFCAIAGVLAGSGENRDLRNAAENYYSSSWSDGTAKMSYKNGAGGLYSVTWTGNKGNFVVGKGWSPGGSK